MPGQVRNEIGKRAADSSAKKGDELGFESLAKRHQRKIFALAFRYTRVREDAEDIVQETSQKAFVYLQKFEGKSSFPTWLRRIAINEALMGPSLAQIREGSFEIHIERGGIHGCDLDDWLLAERELREKYNKSNDGGPKKK